MRDLKLIMSLILVIGTYIRNNGCMGEKYITQGCAMAEGIGEGHHYKFWAVFFLFFYTTLVKESLQTSLRPTP